jgi:hypothetical protein
MTPFFLSRNALFPLLLLVLTHAHRQNRLETIDRFVVVVVFFSFTTGVQSQVVLSLL